MIKDSLLKIQNGETLTEAQMILTMTQIMDGAAAQEDIAAFLLGLSKRGETVAELTGAARVMRAKALSIMAPADSVDCCGTGGDMSGTYNISTAVAIVAAACGVPVAKHGNRSASSKSGAADVLEALGIDLDIPQNKLEEALRLYNFAFLMAPRHHQAMQNVMPVRRSLGVRTIFNLLGPLSNPAGAQFQLLGVYDRKWILPMAQTLRDLGSKCAWVVHGEDGLDEITTTGKTYVAKLEHGEITEMTLSPEDFGLMKIGRGEDLKGGSAQDNAIALREILEGKKNAYRDIVLANTAAVLMIAGKVKDLTQGVTLAAKAIDSGAAHDILRDYTEFTKRK
jgi:anthranilate phosphoribosyltransferase